jgi:hypothetical protein
MLSSISIFLGWWLKDNGIIAFALNWLFKNEQLSFRDVISNNIFPIPDAISQIY